MPESVPGGCFEGIKETAQASGGERSMVEVITAVEIASLCPECNLV